MVRDLLIVHVPGAGQILPGALLQDLRRKRPQAVQRFEAGQILGDLLGHRRGQHPGEGAGHSSHGGRMAEAKGRLTNPRTGEIIN